jgi:hypothetical protein
VVASLSYGLVYLSRKWWHPCPMDTFFHFYFHSDSVILSEYCVNSLKKCEFPLSIVFKEKNKVFNLLLFCRVNDIREQIPLMELKKLMFKYNRKKEDVPSNDNWEVIIT